MQRHGLSGRRARPLNNDLLRKKWRVHYNEHDRLFRAWEDTGYDYPPPNLPAFPPELASLTGGAKNKGRDTMQTEGALLKRQVQTAWRLKYRADKRRGKKASGSKRIQAEK